MSEKTARTARATGKPELTPDELRAKILADLDTNTGKKIAAQWVDALKQVDKERIDLAKHQMIDRTRDDAPAERLQMVGSGVEVRMRMPKDPTDYSPDAELKSYAERRIELEEIKIDIYKLGESGDDFSLKDLKDAVVAAREAQ